MIPLNSHPAVSAGPCPCHILSHFYASLAQNLLVFPLNEVQILNHSGGPVQVELGCGSLIEYLPKTPEGLGAWLNNGVLA